MRIARLAGLLGTLSVSCLWAAEQDGGHSREMMFRIINFAILAGGLGYLIKKNAGAFFVGRSAAIRRGIDEARELVRQSDERAREIGDRLARLDREIAGLRATAKAEMAAEAARIERETEERMRKISAQAEQEIAAAAKAARQQLKAHAAALAIGLAERKIVGRLTSGAQQALVDEFVRGLR